MKGLRSRSKAVALGLIIFVTLNSHSTLDDTVKASELPDFPQIDLTQTADMRIVFLGVSSDFIDESNFMSRIMLTASQFAHPNNITWNFNVSTAFHEFPVNVTNSLTNNAYHSHGTTYYNITLLDELLSYFEHLAAPKRGYLIIFIWVPDNGVNHSWFYIQERPDLFLGRTDFSNGNPAKYWAFPPYFGGMRRGLYFDISEAIEKYPIKATVTDTAVRLFNNALSDVFVDLLGTTDSRMIAADMQRYENYEVKILWLNGTIEQLLHEPIEKAFDDLMPWSNWTITAESKPMDDGLNSLIKSRTTELPKPLNYSFLLANGSRFSIEANQNVMWEVWKNSGENDPISQYLFEHVKDYFNLTDLEDKSIIPITFLTLRNDTTIGGVAGIGPGISWFPHNVIIMGYQGGTLATLGESGPILLTHQLRHEIGHWVSLQHHSAQFELGYPKVICSMRSVTNQFCAFCKDARARISFLSYYQAVSELFSASNESLIRYGNQENLNSTMNKLSDSLQLFYNWDYVEAVKTAIQAYHQTEDAIDQAKNKAFMYTYAIPIAIILAATVFVSLVTLAGRKMKQPMKNP